MIKLIGTPQSRAFRALWLLEELQIPYEIIGLSPHDPEVFKYNPSGKIPALVDDGEVIIDSMAICYYLSDKYKKFTFPCGTINRAKQDSFIGFALDDFETPLWTYGKNISTLPENLRVAEILPTCKYEFAQALKIFEQRLGENRYLMGNQFTIADIFIVHSLTWAKISRFDIPNTGAIADYINRARGRQAYQRARSKRSKNK